MPHDLLKPVETAQYRIAYSHDQISILCKTCGMTSYNAGDVTHRFCKNCNIFHDTQELRGHWHDPRDCEACEAYQRSNDG